MILLLIIILLFVCYSILIVYYWQNWLSIPEFIPVTSPVQTKISVIIPARNEEANIAVLLKKLQQQTYPKELLEIIVIDDHSDDKTAEIVKNFPEVKLLQLKGEDINSYKKKAIETGIAYAANELIVTTDADCMPSPEWLKVISLFKEKNHSAFIAAPVVYNNNSSLLQIFQTLDFLILQGITGVAITKNLMSMCNGANIAYDRKTFYEVNGFSGIAKIASGDDMLLMFKVWKKYPGKCHYLKSKKAMVSTFPMTTWKGFFNQRIRWASKAKRYDDKRIFPILLLVYLFNLSFAVLFIAGIFSHCYWYYLMGLWIAKTIIEFPFINSVASFFSKQQLVKYFFFLQPVHIAYTIIAGLLGQFGKYEWKGRKVK
ncbi:MAG TPA: glycosyltransferase [Chitinophagaceae bacterium]|nr:glycosyltransferase [Chitinophagaceae bacterium]